MARRGRCRCGTVLAFEKTSQGYKTRCNGCGAVVRLQQPAAAPEPAPGAFADLGSLEDLEIRSTDAPPAMAEMPAYGAPPPDGAASWLLWVAVGSAFVVVAIGIAVVYAN